MAATYAALNIWYVEEALAHLSGEERDAVTNPISELKERCEEAWKRYEAADESSREADGVLFVRAQKLLIAATWDALPKPYRPYPFTRASGGAVIGE
jgi:hypothetical protein